MTQPSNLVAETSVVIERPSAEVWDALTRPDAVKHYMFGADVETDWLEGSPIVWRGEWKGRPFEDKGTLLKVEPERCLQYSHFSPLSGQRDEPESYHTVTIELLGKGDQTEVRLAQDHNPDDEARRHAESNWGAMLRALKDYVEQ